MILRGIGALFCSLKRAHATTNMPACTLFNEQNKGPNLLSISTWSVLGKQNVQAKRVYCNIDINFFRIFDRKLRFIGLSAKKTYFNSIFYQGRAILWDRNNFDMIFFALSPFVSISFRFYVVTREASEMLLLKFYYTPAILVCRAETSVLLNEVTVVSWS